VGVDVLVVGLAIAIHSLVTMIKHKKGNCGNSADDDNVDADFKEVTSRPCWVGS